MTWILLIVPSALIGILCSFRAQSPQAIWVAGALPWLGVLSALVYSVYFSGDQTVDATMWPVAQFFGGGIAALIGLGSFVVARWLGNRL